MNKSIVRNFYQQKRLKINKRQVKIASQKISENFIKNLLPQIDKTFDNLSEKKIAFYAPANNEVDPSFIVKHFQKLGNIIVLPKIKPKSLVLDFKQYKIGDKLVSNPVYKNLLEPENSKPNLIPDIVFVPIVAFDDCCRRIGMGGGFYDATIKNLKQTKSLQQSKKKFIGLGYDWQHCEELYAEKWDQILDFIVSNKKIISPSQ